MVYLHVLRRFIDSKSHYAKIDRDTKWTQLDSDGSRVEAVGAAVGAPVIGGSWGLSRGSISLVGSVWSTLVDGDSVSGWPLVGIVVGSAILPTELHTVLSNCRSVSTAAAFGGHSRAQIYQVGQ